MIVISHKLRYNMFPVALIVTVKAINNYHYYNIIGI